MLFIFKQEEVNNAIHIQARRGKELVFKHRQI